MTAKHVRERNVAAVNNARDRKAVAVEHAKALKASRAKDTQVGAQTHARTNTRYTLAIFSAIA